MKLLSGCEVTCFGEKIWERKQGLRLHSEHLKWVERRLVEKNARLETGMTAWPPYNATLFVGGSVYHVEVEG